MASDIHPGKGKRIAILTGGGDTPALNASIKAIRDQAVSLGYEVAGVRRGWAGLLGDGDLVDITHARLDAYYGGTVLRSSRTNPFKGENSQKNQLLRNLSAYAIDLLVVIGGDDTISAAQKLHLEEGFPVIAFPKTIDNDLRTGTFLALPSGNTEVALCPGFPTAVDAVCDYMNRLKTYALSHERVLVVEIMGRDAGWLAASAAAAGADFVLVPEVEMNAERRSAFIEKVKQAYITSEHGFLTVAVAEGVKWYNPQTKLTEVVHAGSGMDDFGHQNFGGISGFIADDLKKATGFPAKGVVSGFYARSGNCSKTDQKLTEALAIRLKEMIINDDFGKMPAIAVIEKNWLETPKTKATALADIRNVPLPKKFYNLEDFNATDEYLDFVKNVSCASNIPVYDEKFKPLKK